MRKRVYLQRGERCRGSNGREGPSRGSEREQRKLGSGVGRSLYQPINDLARLVAPKPILKIIKLDGSRYRKTNTTISQPFGSKYLAVVIFPTRTPRNPNNPRSSERE
ncbi:hypothetical protein MRB53_014015 [Persea americana]|uniref:Uncharacterized protein n=1 Tax=Persea americana TaxID=3435 RepID=A0ACC2K9L7_PERAE|nr:hypothetical protein MRB53_014015 [Persea americana]